MQHRDPETVYLQDSRKMSPPVLLPPGPLHNPGSRRTVLRSVRKRVPGHRPGCARAMPKRCSSGAEAAPKRRRGGGHGGAGAVPAQCAGGAEAVRGRCAGRAQAVQTVPKWPVRPSGA